MNTDDPLLILPLPGGEAAAFTAEQVTTAKERAFKLGFAARQGEDRLNSGTERLLNSKELGELLGVDSTTVESMARDGRLPSIRIGRLLRFEGSVCKAALRVNDGRL